MLSEARVIFDEMESELTQTGAQWPILLDITIPTTCAGVGRAGAAAEVGKLEPDLINPLAEQRHGKADAVPGRDRLFLVA